VNDFGQLTTTSAVTLLPGIEISEIRFTLLHNGGHQTTPGRLEAI